MRKTPKIIISILILAVFGIAGYNYVMYGGARDLSSEKTAFKVSSSSIISEFTSNIESSNKKYLEKPIAVYGIVTAIEGAQVTIDKSIICTLKNPQKIITNQQVIIKGRFVGYDDLMEEIKLDQCFIIND
jgi:predicted negative regulator of RcsB-dependent stress response